MDAGQRAHVDGRRHHRLHAQFQTGVGPARSLSDHQHAGERDQPRHGRRSAWHGISPLRPRARPAPATTRVCRLHFQSAVHCVGGNDDYTDIKIEGAHGRGAHLGRFMKKAVTLPQYSDTNGFTAPEVFRLSPLTRPATCSATPLAPTAPILHSLTAPRRPRPATTPEEHRNLLQRSSSGQEPEFRAVYEFGIERPLWDITEVPVPC